MKKIFTLSMILALAAMQAWAATVDVSTVGLPFVRENPEIIVDVDELDFGEGYNGYNEIRTFNVTGVNLIDNITVTLGGIDSIHFVLVGPKTITPEEAAQGVEVEVRFFVMKKGFCNARLTLSSQGAQDVVIPLKGFGIKTSAFIIPEEESLSFETRVGVPVTRKLVVERREFDGWLAAPPRNFDFEPIDTIDFPIVYDEIACITGTIEGDDCFCRVSARTTGSSENSKWVTFTISYCPMTEGQHSAQLKLTSSLAYPVTVDLTGVATISSEPGDIDGDGQVNIQDLVTMIDAVLQNQTDMLNNTAVDFNGDGRVSISDITAMIDLLLGQ